MAAFLSVLVIECKTRPTKVFAERVQIAEEVGVVHAAAIEIPPHVPEVFGRDGDLRELALSKVPSASSGTNVPDGAA